MTTTAQNCLLLLHVKNALKEEYGITDAKVRQFLSNGNQKGAAKLYDKPPPRRQVIRYQPNQIEALKHGPPPCPVVGDMQGRQMLVAQLVDFKQLVDSLDQDAIAAAVNEGDEDEGFDLDEDGEEEYGEDGQRISPNKKNKKATKRGRNGKAGASKGGKSKSKSAAKKKKPQGESDLEDFDDWPDFSDMGGGDEEIDFK